MAFKTVQSLDADNTVRLGGFDKKTKKDNPTTTEGYYLGKRVVTGGKFGDSTLHFLQTPKGNLGVWGKSDMDKKLAAVAAGTMVRISFTGTRPTNKGNDQMIYKVEHDPENTIEVNIDMSSSNDSEENYSDDSPTDTDDVMEDEDDEDTVQASALAALERKQKVEALLKTGKSKR